MDKQIKDIFCKLIDTELDKISKLPSLNDATLDNLHKLTDTKKNLLKIDKLEMEMMGGNSYGYNGYSYAQNQGGNSNGYMMSTPYMGNSMNQGYSMAPNNQSNTGSYDNNGYSRMDSRSHLEAALREARNEQEREEIRQLMAKHHI